MFWGSRIEALHTKILLEKFKTRPYKIGTKFKQTVEKLRADAENYEENRRGRSSRETGIWKNAL